MLLKAGVDISRLNREIRRALPKIETVYVQYSETFVITSTYEGNHGAGSLHYGNDAVDVGLAEANATKIYNVIKERLKGSFDVVLEGDHIHIEYDPK